MADIVDEDSGDVGNFPTPPRHQEDIDKQVSELRDKLMDFMMENMMDYAELNARDFAIHCAHHLGFMVRLYKTNAESLQILKEFSSNYRSGMDDAEEALENQEEDPFGE